ncbi:MAG: isocitrate/isopropylmalate dehydrogenase family protein [SAR324 cluster bacterium]
MAAPVRLNIAEFPGDGIGIEVMKAAKQVLNRAESMVGGFKCTYLELPAGAFCYKETGEALPKASVDAADKADAMLLGACGWPEIRYPDGTEIRPQVELRFIFDLYAGVRPIRFYPGIPPVLANPLRKTIDLILIRESTEGLFASRGSGKNPEVATETLVITRAKTEKLMHFAYRLARRRKGQGHPGKLTCVDKANIFSSMAFYRAIYDRIGLTYPDIEKEYCLVDAMALNLVRKPWDYDVMVMENMFGDILSDLGAGIVGGLGMAPSGDIGDTHWLFQPSHGTAPDIAGKGIANPTAMILSGAMLFDHLADRREAAALAKAARLIEGAVERYLRTGQRLPVDQGGQAGTGEVVERVIAEMEAGGTA